MIRRSKTAQPCRHEAYAKRLMATVADLNAEVAKLMVKLADARAEIAFIDADRERLVKADSKRHADEQNEAVLDVQRLASIIARHLPSTPRSRIL